MSENTKTKWSETVPVPDELLAIQMALCCLSAIGNDPDVVAETHPGVAGALRVLLPFAAPRTRYAMGLDPPQPEWTKPAPDTSYRKAALMMADALMGPGKVDNTECTRSGKLKPVK